MVSNEDNDQLVKEREANSSSSNIFKEEKGKGLADVDAGSDSDGDAGSDTNGKKKRSRDDDSDSDDENYQRSNKKSRFVSYTGGPITEEAMAGEARLHGGSMSLDSLLKAFKIYQGKQKEKKQEDKSRFDTFKTIFQRIFEKTPRSDPTMGKVFKLKQQFFINSIEFGNFEFFFCKLLKNLTLAH